MVFVTLSNIVNDAKGACGSGSCHISFGCCLLLHSGKSSARSHKDSRILCRKLKDALPCHSEFAESLTALPCLHRKRAGLHSGTSIAHLGSVTVNTNYVSFEQSFKENSKANITMNFSKFLKLFIYSFSVTALSWSVLWWTQKYSHHFWIHLRLLYKYFSLHNIYSK